MTLESIASEINRVELGYGRLAGKDKKESREEQVFPAFFIHISPSFSHNNHTDKR